MKGLTRYIQEAMKSPVTWVVALLGAMLVPLSLYMAQREYVPGTAPQGAWIALYRLLTAVPQVLFSFFDPFIGRGWRHSRVTFYVFVGLSTVCNLVVFGVLGFATSKLVRRKE